MFLNTGLSEVSDEILLKAQQLLGSDEILNSFLNFHLVSYLRDESSSYTPDAFFQLVCDIIPEFESLEDKTTPFETILSLVPGIVIVDY